MAKCNHFVHCVCSSKYSKLLWFNNDVSSRFLLSKYWKSKSICQFLSVLFYIKKQSFFHLKQYWFFGLLEFIMQLQNKSMKQALLHLLKFRAKLKHFFHFVYKIGLFLLNMYSVYSKRYNLVLGMKLHFLIILTFTFISIHIAYFDT